MQLDELTDVLLQPQQDMQVRVEIEGELREFEAIQKDGFFVFKPKD